MGWKVAAVLVAMLLLVAGGYAFVKLRQNSIPSSGNPLFDKYVGYLWSDYVERRKKDKDTIPGFEIPFDVVVEWEPQFGNDPRYWELRSVSAGWKALRAVPASGHTPTQSEIEESGRRLETAARDSLASAYAAGKLNSNGVLLLWFKSRNANQTKQLEYLDKAVELDSDYCWAWYCRGLFFLEHGNKEKAAVDLEVGNKLRPAHFPQPFPNSLIHDTLLTGRPVAATRLSGMNYTGSFEQLWVRNAVVTHVTVDDVPTNLHLLTELNKFADSMFEGDKGIMINALMALSVSEWVERRVCDYAEITLVDKDLNNMLDDMDGLYSRMGDLGSQWLAHLTGQKPSSTKPTAIQKLVEGAKAKTTKAFPQKLHLRELDKQQREEARFTAAKYQPYFSALAKFDYEHPARYKEITNLLHSVPDPYPQDTRDKASRRREPQFHANDEQWDKAHPVSAAAFKVATSVSRKGNDIAKAKN